MRRFVQVSVSRSVKKFNQLKIIWQHGDFASGIFVHSSSAAHEDKKESMTVWKIFHTAFFHCCSSK